MLKLGDDIFEDKESIDYDNDFLFLKSKKETEANCWYLTIKFKDGYYKNDTTYHFSPGFNINKVSTRKKSIEELIGEVFLINNVNDSFEREDWFYFYEFEPMENYIVKILEIKDGKIHVQAKGTMFIDSFERKGANKDIFEIDSWVPYRII